MAAPSPRLFEAIPTGSAITAVQPLPSDPNIRRIVVNGRTVARLRAGDVERLALAPGKSWTKRLAQAIADAIAADKARRAAMSILSRRGFARGELVERLTQRGHETSIAEQVVRELAGDGWLDDAEYARTVAQLLIERKGASERFIIDTLRKRRIDETLAGRIAKEALRDVDEIDAAAGIIETRARAMKGQPNRTIVRRLAGTLARRGYGEETIFAALARAGFSPEDETA